jgi:hypothetical protein
MVWLNLRHAWPTATCVYFSLRDIKKVTGFAAISVGFLCFSSWEIILVDGHFSTTEKQRKACAPHNGKNRPTHPLQHGV